ncbi:DUF2948 family protein [Pseudaquidulcibacter saccharophilus]|uniref:DUF2948 family protein n=1 Tax=Pseudaquidulcibacter saccharophilus TaxID=2831900 RepID=UPI001EFF47ED|nr:DUF2948 family protein [Pseudaquidulcibacter saccharophilus]
MRLIALEAEDLTTIAAACQDALFLAQNATYSAQKREFTLLVNRFRWEDDEKNQRVQALLSFSSVKSVKALGVDKNSQIPKSILSIEFIHGKEAPEGEVIFELAGGGKISLAVECVDIILGDIGEAVDVKKRPDHNGDK